MNGNGFTFVGRKPCGCCVALAVDQDPSPGVLPGMDYNQVDLALELLDWLHGGLTIVRLSDAEVRATVMKEPSFMRCAHDRTTWDQELES